MHLSSEQLYQHYITCTAVSTDTRKIEPGTMFFALTGKNFNGNAFAKEALSKGAKFAVINDGSYAEDDQFLVVEDTLKALQQLANYHRRKLAIPFIGITGSNGKTTTKELTNAVLSQKYRTYATIGNLNNHIGVPLTILAIKPEVEIAIIEMGANFVGDIKGLVEICEPTHGVITNIGKAHLEGFGGEEGVKKGKGELYDFLSNHQGVVFINSGSEILTEVLNHSNRAFSEIVSYPAKEDFYYAQLLESSPTIVYQDKQNKPISTYLTGTYNFENIAAALCIGKYFGVPADNANQAVSQYQPDNNRSQIIKKGSNTILMDAYNANPTSMQASIRNFVTLPAAKKVVILGDMFELGEAAPEEHRQLGALLNEARFDLVILCGKLMQYAVESNPRAYYFPDKFSLHNWIADNPIKEASILIKGSRSMSLETVLPFIN